MIKMATGMIAAVGAGRVLFVFATVGAVWGAVAHGPGRQGVEEGRRSGVDGPAARSAGPSDDRVRAEASDRGAERDRLFMDAPTEVSRVRRAEQIRRANEAPSLATPAASIAWRFLTTVMTVIAYCAGFLLAMALGGLIFMTIIFGVFWKVLAP